MTKKIFAAIEVAIEAAAVSVFVYANNGMNSMDDIFNANVEALASGESNSARIWFVDVKPGGDAITCTLGGNSPCK